jgi:hypothetical protein
MHSLLATGSLIVQLRLHHPHSGSNFGKKRVPQPSAVIPEEGGNESIVAVSD